MIARTDTTSPSTADWVNVFGPDGYNVQPDTTRNRKIGRVHLPDVLKVGFLPLHRVDCFVACAHQKLSLLPLPHPFLLCSAFCAQPCIAHN